MTLESFVGGFITAIIGIALMYSYVYYVGRKLGVRMNLIASIAYNVNTDGMSSSIRTIESFMRVPKYFGVFLVIMGPIIMFNPS
jgi:small basic protein